MKYHIGKRGKPAQCRARKGNCPLGSDQPHFDTKEEANAYIEHTNGDTALQSSTKKTGSRFDKYTHFKKVGDSQKDTVSDNVNTANNDASSTVFRAPTLGSTIDTLDSYETYKNRDFSGKTLDVGRLQEVNFIECNLAGATIVNTNLGNVNFRDSNLSGATFKDCSGDRVDFHGAKVDGLTISNSTMDNVRLDGATITGMTPENSAKALYEGTPAVPDLFNPEPHAPVRGINVSNSTLSNASFRRADLSNSTFYNSTIEQDGFYDMDDPGDAPFYRANFSGSTFTNVTSQESDFDAANLDGCTVSGCDFTESSFGGYYRDATIKDSAFSVDMSHSKFVNSSFSNLDMDSATLDFADVDGCDFNNVNLSSASLRETDMRYTDIRSSSFFQANIDGAKFYDAELVRNDFNADCSREYVDGLLLEARWDEDNERPF